MSLFEFQKTGMVCQNDTRLWLGRPCSMSIWLPMLRWEMFWGSTAFHLKGHVDPRLALLGEGGEQLYHPVGELEIISLQRSEQSLQHREEIGEVVP